MLAILRGDFSERGIIANYRPSCPLTYREKGNNNQAIPNPTKTKIPKDREAYRTRSAVEARKSAANTTEISSANKTINKR
jgi:hypothetical protein